VLILRLPGLKDGKKLSGEAPSPGFRPWFLEIVQKLSPAWQDKICQVFIRAHNETLAVPATGVSNSDRLPSASPVEKVG